MKVKSLKGFVSLLPDKAKSDLPKVVLNKGDSHSFKSKEEMFEYSMCINDLAKMGLVEVDLVSAPSSVKPKVEPKPEPKMEPKVEVKEEPEKFKSMAKPEPEKPKYSNGKFGKKK